MSPRGVRINNPCNIRHSQTVWKGEADLQPDADFVAFISADYGLRAGARILLTYELKGFDTVAKIIRRWAPPNENDTAAYIADVARQVGVNPDAPVDLKNPGLMAKMLAAIVRHENGEQPYTDATLDRAVQLALESADA
jgi:hypothetical protein